MTGSAISTPTYQAQNSNIANDGSADSPRGYASITSTGTFTVTKGGASLYRVAVTSPAAPITATLPTDVKAGYRVRFEVELTSSTETNCFFTSPSIAEAQINGTGFVELMAKIDNPSVAGDWKVVDVEEISNITPVTPTWTGTTAPTTVASQYFVFSRKGKIGKLSFKSRYTNAGTAITVFAMTSVVPSRITAYILKTSGWDYIAGYGGIGAGTTGPFARGAVSQAWFRTSDGTFAIETNSINALTLQAEVHFVLQ